MNNEDGWSKGRQEEKRKEGGKNNENGWSKGERQEEERRVAGGKHSREREQRYRQSKGVKSTEEERGDIPIMEDQQIIYRKS